MTEMQPYREDNRTLFEKLQTAEGLDLRGQQGKEHDAAVILMVLSNDLHLIGKLRKDAPLFEKYEGKHSG